MKKPEIERRFLLRGMPKWKDVHGERFVIHQFYCEASDGPCRARMETFGDGRQVFTKNRKVELSFGVFDEDEEEISEVMYNALALTRTRELTKLRERTPQKELIWEIDAFHPPLRIVLAEIELPAIDHAFEMPDCIKEVLLMEVTGMKQFSNYALAAPIGK